MSQFPCFVFRAPGAIVRARYTYDTMLVATQDHLDQRLASGWFLSLGEAIEAAGSRAARISRVKPKPPRKPSKPIDGINRRLAKPEPVAAAPEPAPAPEPEQTAAVPDDGAPVTREELEAKATELGIPFNGRTSNKKLTSLIETALAQAAGG